MNTTTRRLAVVTALVGLVLLAIWWFALFSPQNHKLSAQHKARAAAEQQTTRLESQVVQLNALLHQIPADNAKLAQYSAAVPNGADLSGALRDIQQAANTSGVTMSSLTPAAQDSSGTNSSSSSNGSSASSGGASSLGVSISASGPYNALMTFLTLLNQMPRTLVVNSLNISGSGTSLSAQISSEIFYEK